MNKIQIKQVFLIVLVYFIFLAICQFILKPIFVTLKPDASKQCLVDEHRHIRSIELIDKDFYYWLEIFTGNKEEGFITHGGPKVGYTLLGFLTYKGLKILDSKLNIKESLFFLNITFIYIQIVFIWLFLKEHHITKLVDYFLAFALITLCLLQLPHLIQYLYTNTYNSVFGAQILASFYFTKKAFNSYLKQRANYLVPFSYQNKRHVIFLIISGFIAFSTLLVSSSAPLYIFLHLFFVFLIFNTPEKGTINGIPIREIVFFSAGGLLAILPFEILFQLFNGSFLYEKFGHIQENIYKNHFQEPFAYFPLFSVFYFFYNNPASLVFTLLCGALIFLKQNNNRWNISLIILIATWILSFDLLPIVPVGRVLYSFYIINIVFWLGFLTTMKWDAKPYLSLLLILIGINTYFIILRAGNICQFEYDASLYRLLTHIYVHPGFAWPQFVRYYAIFPIMVTLACAFWAFKSNHKQVSLKIITYGFIAGMTIGTIYYFSVKHFVTRNSLEWSSVVTTSSTLQPFKPNLLLIGQEIWHSQSPPKYPEWVQIKLNKSKKIHKISIKSQGTSPGGDEYTRAPKHFKIQGSNMGKNWNDILEVKDAVYTYGHEWKHWSLPTDQPYLYYRILIYSNNGHSNLLTVEEINFN